MYGSFTVFTETGFVCWMLFATLPGIPLLNFELSSMSSILKNNKLRQSTEIKKIYIFKTKKK